jgi:hypothetical protein
MRYKMGGCYKTHRLSALLKAWDDIFNHLIHRHDSFFNWSPIPADLEILAINALEVATGKENIADTMSAAYNRFLAKMDAYGTDVIACVRSAIPGFSHIAVYSTETGADHTVVEFFHRPKIKGFRVQ